MSKFKKNTTVGHPSNVQAAAFQQHKYGAQKYIKNVMNIPSYMQDKSGGMGEPP